MLKVVYNRLSVEEVHGGSQPVPVDALGRSNGPCSTRDVGDGNNFAERDDLNSSDDDDDINVSHEESGEETPNHDQGPDRSGNESGLLFLIVALFAFC